MALRFKIATLEYYILGHDSRSFDWLSHFCDQILYHLILYIYVCHIKIEKLMQQCLSLRINYIQCSAIETLTN